MLLLVVNILYGLSSAIFYIQLCFRCYFECSLVPCFFWIINMFSCLGFLIFSYLLIIVYLLACSTYLLTNFYLKCCVNIFFSHYSVFSRKHGDLSSWFSNDILKSPFHCLTYPALKYFTTCLSGIYMITCSLFSSCFYRFPSSTWSHYFLTYFLSVRCKIVFNVTSFQGGVILEHLVWPDLITTSLYMPSFLPNG